MALSPNEKTIASGSNDHDIVYALCWRADGERVASGSWDGTARVWDVDTGKNILIHQNLQLAETRIML
jgi:WD40 repeat protein